MPKKKTPGKHLQFYMDCMEEEKIPYPGLCSCAAYLHIDEALLDKFSPDNFFESVTFWGGDGDGDRIYVFTPLRQTIVLFMAAINNEL